MTRKGKKVRSPKALQSRGGYRVGVCSPPKDFKFLGSEMPFPALSTGHFNKYERKSKWLEYILPISNVVVKVQCLRKKGKTVTPSRITSKGQDSLYDSRLSSSLLRNIPSQAGNRGGARGAFAPSQQAPTVRILILNIQVKECSRLN